MKHPFLGHSAASVTHRALAVPTVSQFCVTPKSRSQLLPGVCVHWYLTPQPGEANGGILSVTIFLYKHGFCWKTYSC